jgi:Ni/Co efflux regulator RcnB
MKTNLNVILTTLLAVSGTVAIAQDRGDRNGRNRQEVPQFTQHDQQVAHDWYNQHQTNPPAGFRNQDRLSSDQESRLHEGAVLDKELRRRVHSAPPDLYRQLPPPPSRHRYVGIGDHLALIDNGYQVKAVIHLHDNH